MSTVRKKRSQTETWVSLVEAARMLGEARQTVLTRVVKRELVADHVAGRTVVTRASVEALLVSREA